MEPLRAATANPNCKEGSHDRVRHASDEAGVVRELRNAIKRALILCEGGLVTAQHLPVTIAVHRSAPSGESTDQFPAGGVNLGAIERDWIERALAKAKNNKSLAAKLLGLPRGRFYSLLRRHELTNGRG